MIVCAARLCPGLPRVRQDLRKLMHRGRDMRDRRADITGPPLSQDALDQMRVRLTREVKDGLGLVRETSKSWSITALMGWARGKANGDICAVENGQNGPAWGECDADRRKIAQDEYVAL